MKTFPLSVSDFGLPVPRTGHIELHSGYGPLPEVGAEIHRWLQEARIGAHADFQPERPVQRTFEREGFKFVISGRMDGFFERPRPRIEEIKSAYDPAVLVRRLKERPDHPYLLQLRTYGYFEFLATGRDPELVLIVVSSRNRDVEELTVALDPPSYEAWLERRLAELVTLAREERRIVARRKTTAAEFQFPFEHPRQGQMDLVRAVEEGVRDRAPLLLQAPTGLGKTAGVLSPMLKDALARGQKVLYVTPKNSQHAVAEETLARLRERGTKVKSLTINSKAKMCFKNEPVCNPEACEFARDHYTKVHAGDLVARLARKKSLTPRTFRAIARDHQVCPFELQFDVAPRVDVVVCDYNYVFSPRSAIARLGGSLLRRKNSPNLVIDEAHNLPARARDYFSPAISARELSEWGDRMEFLPADLRRDARALVAEGLRLIERAGTPGGRSPSVVRLDFDVLTAHRDQVARVLARYLESSLELRERDPVVRWSSLWSEFVEAGAALGEGSFVTHRPDPWGGVLKIVCCDASDFLAKTYRNFANVAAFSATLKPFDFYRRTCGLPVETTRAAEFDSPFSPANRKLLVIPQVSTKYADRAREIGKIADAIERIVRLKPGNYFAFFPSFEFMSQVADRVALPEFDLFRQERDMRSSRIEEVLGRLREPDSSRPAVVFGVQGGVLAEGVDYPGDMLIGAIVVGPALPTFDFDRELMRDYFERKHGHGFDYAYVFPAMAKTVQAAGRVIRSPTDRGIVVLMDRRFLEEAYAQAMPADWGEARQLVSGQVLTEIREFWEGEPPSS